LSFQGSSRFIRAWLQLSLAGIATVQALPVESRTTVWRTDHRAGALPILFMLAAETEAAGHSVVLTPKQKTHRRFDDGFKSTL
jgi:hypothetical protein